MNGRFFSILILSAALSGCAGLRTPTDADLAEYHADQAQRAFAMGNRPQMALQIDEAAARTGGTARINAFFAAAPAAKAAYIQELQHRIDSQVSTAGTADSVLRGLKSAAAAGIISSQEYVGLVERLTHVVEEGNLSGLVRIDLGDNIDQFPGLKSPEQQRAMADNTIAVLQEAGGKYRPIARLMAYAARSGRGSPEWRRIESQLPTMNIKRSELGIVAAQFPDFAEPRRAATQVDVRLNVKNADRIFKEDLRDEMVASISGLEWGAPASDKTIEITVERLRHDERSLRERTETVTYRQGDINVVSAVLLMPQNASYAYDVLIGGNEIEYGYVITATQGGRQLADDLVRGKVENGYEKCLNPRIQNVFGGVTRADFVANDDQQRRCSGQQSASIDDLRKIVLERIVAGIRRIGPIKAVHEMGD